MQLSPLTTRNMKITARVIGISSVIGAIIGVFSSSETNLALDIVMGALTGIVIGLGSTIAEIFFLNTNRVRQTSRLPPIFLMLLRGTIFSVVILFGLSVPGIIKNTGLPWEDPNFAVTFLLSALVAFSISTLIEINRLLGREASLSLLTGRYHRPRLEHRVVLFADVVGSTALAERIGELEFHNFLRNVAQDVAAPIEQARGSVHRYVGDAIIVTWPLARGLQNADCLNCAKDMHAALADRADHYVKRFGTRPELRIAIHCGQLAAGEIGDWKKEIALLGDVMNTTARIESAAKTLNTPTAISDTLMQAIPKEFHTAYSRLPDITAAGKQHELRLWAPQP